MSKYYDAVGDDSMLDGVLKTPLKLLVADDPTAPKLDIPWHTKADWKIARLVMTKYSDAQLAQLYVLLNKVLLNKTADVEASEEGMPGAVHSIKLGMGFRQLLRDHLEPLGLLPLGLEEPHVPVQRPPAAATASVDPFFVRLMMLRTAQAKMQEADWEQE